MTLGQDRLSDRLRGSNHKRSVDNLTALQVRTSVHQKTTFRKCIGKPQCGRRLWMPAPTVCKEHLQINKKRQTTRHLHGQKTPTGTKSKWLKTLTMITHHNSN